MDCAYPHLVYRVQVKLCVLLEAFSQLIRRLVCECDYQHGFGIGTLFQKIAHPFDDYPCFSGSGTCIYHQGLVCVLDSLPLIIVKLDFRWDFTDNTSVCLPDRLEIQLACQWVAFGVEESQCQNVILYEAVEIFTHEVKYLLLVITVQVFNSYHVITHKTYQVGRY